MTKEPSCHSTYFHDYLIALQTPCTVTRRKQTIPEIYSYYSRDLNILCVPDKWNLYSLVVYKNNEEIERIDDMVSGELHDHLDRLKTKYILGHSELPAYKPAKK